MIFSKCINMWGENTLFIMALRDFNRQVIGLAA